MIPGSLRWVEPGPIQVDPAVRDLLPGPGFLAEAVARRGLNDPDRLNQFLNPNLYRPSPADDLPDLSKAVDRIVAAIQRDELIGVWGDFDVDGQTATAILVQGLSDLGARVRYYIPVRGRESHGVSLPSLENFLDQGVQLILTCDTGISAHEAVAYTSSRQVDFIITDHHSLPDELPEALAVVNPQRLPAGHPLAALCGAGCAYQVLAECQRRSGRPQDAGAYQDLAALGTIADLAPLVGDNRWLVQRGLERIRQAPRPALQAMFELAEIDYAQISEEQVSFHLAPRLNALGRLGDANPAVPFLLAKTIADARPLAAQFEALNVRRKALCDQVFQAAQSQIERDRGLLERPVLLLSHPAWPGGVLGIVASRLVELYQRPTLLLATPPGELARGSARSIDGIDITQAIGAAASCLTNYGGHPMAAGFALDPSHLAEFHRSLDQAVLAQTPGEERAGELQIDAYLPMDSLTLDLAEAVERLAPFGPGNPPLVFASRGLGLRSQTLFGKSRDHLQMIVEDDAGVARKVTWWQGAGAPAPEGRFDLAYTVRGSLYRGRRSLQIEWLHARPVPESLEVTVRKGPQEIQDYRDELDPRGLLGPFLGQSGVLVYAEGEIPFRAQARDRFHLEACDTLVVWSVPPGRRELQDLLDAVHPRRVAWFGVATSGDQLAPFRTRLSGLVHTVLNRREGLVTLPELASATAQRDVTVRKGLAWLAAQGSITLTEIDPVTVFLQAGGPAEPTRAEALELDLAYLLNETSAFRKFCRKVDLRVLSG